MTVGPGATTLKQSKLEEEQKGLLESRLVTRKLFYSHGDWEQVWGLRLSVDPSPVWLPKLRPLSGLLPWSWQTTGSIMWYWWSWRYNAYFYAPDDFKLLLSSCFTAPSPSHTTTGPGGKFLQYINEEIWLVSLYVMISLWNNVHQLMRTHWECVFSHLLSCSKSSNLSFFLWTWPP